VIAVYFDEEKINYIQQGLIEQIRVDPYVFVAISNWAWRETVYGGCKELMDGWA
jgi:hypothetical protein